MGQKKYYRVEWENLDRMDVSGHGEWFTDSLAVVIFAKEGNDKYLPPIFHWVKDTLIDLRPITRQDLFDYFQECKNDSTMKINWVGRGRVFIQKGYPLDEYDFAYIEPETTYVHHKKPTFQGFKEWLEKEMREK
jgi:hypothetical protein